MPADKAISMSMPTARRIPMAAVRTITATIYITAWGLPTRMRPA